MPKKGLLGGSKITKNHSSVIPDAVKIITFAKTLSEVKMVVPSEIVSLRPAELHIKFSPIQAGLKLAVRGKNARQIFYIYTSSPSTVDQLVNDYWNKLQK